VRTEATGYGLSYFTEEMLKARKSSLKGKRVVISGSGNVAIYAREKVTQLGGRVIAMSDSNGFVVDEKGFNLETIKTLKEVERRRIRDYCEYHKQARFVQSGNIWDVPCDVALPCATQNELTGKDARKLVKNGVIAVAEGANMPTTPEGVQVFHGAGVLFGPGKAANAGGVATSALEMQQNAAREAGGFEETDSKLRQIMRNIYHVTFGAAEEFGSTGNLVMGANIAGFIKVARAMIAHGLV
jgi:glutamate dehydrogenase (NADP+)